MSVAIQRQQFWLWQLVCCWFLLSVSAIAAMAVYGARAGDSADAPEIWPDVATNELTRHPKKPTIVLFAHPLCPCTRATLWELERLSHQFQHAFSTQVLFFEPEDTSAMADIWAASSLKQLARRIPAAQLYTDKAGALSAEFGAYTSGQVLLYDANGRLRFEGGITPSRGHTGTNPGRAAIVNALLNDASVDLFSVPENPVYGCSLRGDSADDRFTDDRFKNSTSSLRGDPLTFLAYRNTADRS